MFCTFELKNGFKDCFNFYSFTLEDQKFIFLTHETMRILSLSTIKSLTVYLDQIIIFSYDFNSEVFL